MEIEKLIIDIDYCSADIIEYEIININNKLQVSRYEGNFRNNNNKEKYIDKKNTIDCKEFNQFLNDINILSWNNFNESNSDILDGESFNLYLKTKNNEIIEAHGNNSFPPKYFDLINYICEILK